MEYSIHNVKSVGDKEQRNRVRSIIDKQILRLESIEGNYLLPLKLNIHINKTGRVNFVVSASINMKEGVVFVKEKGDVVEAILHVLFDKLKVTLNNKINKERKEQLRKSRNRNNKMFNEYLPELQELKLSDTRETFNELLKILLSDVAKYVKRRIKSAEMTTAIKRGKFKKQEILDDIYLYVYDHLNEISVNDRYSRIWLYQIADRIMEEKFNEIEFESKNLERLNEIVELEYATLEEEFTVDAEEEIIPVEELDDFRGQADMEMATMLLGEDEESILDELTLNINNRVITRLLEQELEKLPMSDRTIMEFYLISQMSIFEISEIKKIPEVKIEELTTRVCRELKNKLASKLLK